MDYLERALSEFSGKIEKNQNGEFMTALTSAMKEAQTSGTLNANSEDHFPSSGLV